MLKVRIGGLQKSSLIDYPGKISAVIFTSGCNFRCPYCHNPELIMNSGAETSVSAPNVLKFLQSRVGKLDGVVITGGEPTLHKDLPKFIEKIKNLGFCVKLDTNGTNPDMLQSLIDDFLIDYVAIDIKAPIEKYSQVANVELNIENILKSIQIIRNSQIDYEFRTTVVKSQLFAEDFEKIGEMLKGAKKYYLQKFVPSKTLDESFMKEISYSDIELSAFAVSLLKNIDEVFIR